MYFSVNTSYKYKMTVYLVNGNVWDEKKGGFFRADVKITGKKISGVGLMPEREEGAAVTDCAGKYIVPGIIDAHVHLVWDGRSPDPMGDTVRDGDFLCFAKGAAGALDSLRAGVTTVRDLGANNDVTLPMASAVNRRILPGCRILPAGSAIQGSYGHCPMIGFIANTEAQLIERVKRLKGNMVEMHLPPVHWVKIMASGGAAGAEDVGPCMYSQRELRALTDEAHRLNMRVAAHALSYRSIKACVDAGIDTIEHGAQMTEELLLKMKEQGQCWVPTLAVYKSLAESEGIVAPEIVEKARAVAKRQRESFEKALETGTRIILGSDSGSANFGPHPAAYQEMDAMHAYGMDTARVIRAATSEAADVLGAGENIGRIEAGKNADLLVLNGNPVRDLRVFTEGLWKIYKEGTEILPAAR